MNSRVPFTAIVCWQTFTPLSKPHLDVLASFSLVDLTTTTPRSRHHGLGTYGTDKIYVTQSSGQLAMCCTQADECNPGPLDMG